MAPGVSAATVRMFALIDPVKDADLAVIELPFATASTGRFLSSACVNFDSRRSETSDAREIECPE